MQPARQTLGRARGIVAAALTALAFVSSGPAHAHLGNISYADFRAQGHEVHLKFKYAAHVTPGWPAPEGAKVTRQQVLAMQGAVESWLAGASSMSSGGKPCTLTVDNLVGPDANDDLEALAYWTCDVPEVRGFRLDFHPLDSVIDDWQTICSITLDGDSLSTVLSPGTTRWTVGDAGPAVPVAGSAGDAGDAGGAGDSGAAGDAGSAGGTGHAAEAGEATAVDADDAEAGGSAFTRFFVLGVEHIWTGYDHLLFLLAVLLAGGGLWRLAGIVTSFTVAHSVTLGAAATGLVTLPVAPVEAAIALSIVYVACENLLEVGRDRRALVTFGFGLIHGFGFASMLADAGLPASGVLVPLLAFNLGVEAGQLAVVVVVVPILAVVLRGPHAKRIRNALSVLIAIAGAVWAVERVAAML